MTLFHSFESVEMMMQDRLDEREHIRDARRAQQDARGAIGHGAGNDSAEATSSGQVRRQFLDRAYRSVAQARRRAGLSREQVAARAGVSLDVVAAVEGDTPTNVTIEDYVDVALACGYLPLDVTLAPVADVREFEKHVPTGVRTAPAFETWLAQRGVRRALAAAGTAKRETK